MIIDMNNPEHVYNGLHATITIDDRPLPRYTYYVDDEVGLIKYYAVTDRNEMKYITDENGKLQAIPCERYGTVKIELKV